MKLENSNQMAQNEQTDDTGQPEQAKVAETQFSPEYIQERIASVSYWFHRIEVAPGIFTPGQDDPASRLHQMHLPERLDGKKVLDIGAYNGFFSLECERRGAEVIALDVIPPEVSGFAVIQELTGSKIRHVRGSIYNLDFNELGQFDIVLCLGVLYHLRHPLLGLDKIYSICKDLLILESQICDNCFVNEAGQPITLESLSPALKRLPLAQFYPNDELNLDPSNWWSPNQIGLQRMIESSGFEARLVYTSGVRAVFHCLKTERPDWVEDEAKQVQSKLPAMIERSQATRAGLDSPQLQEMEEELRKTKQQLHIISNSRTWRLSSKLSHSRFGRWVSRLIGPWLS